MGVGGRGTGAGSGRESAKDRPPARVPRPLIITPALLRRWPLPQPDKEGDKEERGRVLVVGGRRRCRRCHPRGDGSLARMRMQVADRTCLQHRQVVQPQLPEARVFRSAGNESRSYRGHCFRRDCQARRRSAGSAHRPVGY